MNAARLLPWLVFAAALAAWEITVRVAQIPHYILPAPSLILETLARHFDSLAPAWWYTVRITAGALALSVLSGVGLAGLFALSPWVERSKRRTSRSASSPSPAPRRTSWPTRWASIRSRASTSKW